MARFAPAECSPCAIAQAMERLLATPNTTAVLPLRSSNMNGSSPEKKKNNSLLVWSGHSCPLCWILGLILIPGVNVKINVKGSGQECPLYTKDRKNVVEGTSV